MIEILIVTLLLALIISLISYLKRIKDTYKDEIKYLDSMIKSHVLNAEDRIAEMLLNLNKHLLNSDFKSLLTKVSNLEQLTSVNCEIARNVLQLKEKIINLEKEIMEITNSKLSKEPTKIPVELENELIKIRNDFNLRMNNLEGRLTSEIRR